MDAVCQYTVGDGLARIKSNEYSYHRGRYQQLSRTTADGRGLKIQLISIPKMYSTRVIPGVSNLPVTCYLHSP